VKVTTNKEPVMETMKRDHTETGIDLDQVTGIATTDLPRETDTDHPRRDPVQSHSTTEKPDTITSTATTKETDMSQGEQNTRSTSTNVLSAKKSMKKEHIARHTHELRI
jgi:hypothetical protein